MEPALQIYLLGTFGLTVQGRRVPGSAWQKRKARLLVQILALQRSKSLHRETLVETLFPDAEFQAANDNFYRVVYAARHALEPDLPPHSKPNYLVPDGGQLVLCDPDCARTDAEEFECQARQGLRKNDLEILKAAEADYRGDLLEEEPHEEWTFEPRERLKALHHAILRRLATEAEASGDFLSAHDWLDKALAAEPADEASHRAKMRLFHFASERSLALRQYEICAAALRRELDVVPEPETELLRQKLVNNGQAPG
jgi:DNA-binding SARP family transcriptional activator